MKKLFLLLTIIFSCLLFTGCSSLKTISLDELKEKLDNKESFILEVIQTDCSHCKEFSPRFKKVLKDNNLTAYQIDTQKLSENEKKEFDSIIYVSGTPTVVFIKDGEEKATHYRISGAVSNDKIIEKLKKAGYIK
ncbi:MAG: thioredoxin domain-containing protein [Bacilli bacterium]